MRSVMAARSNWYSAAHRLGIRGTEFVSCFDFNILRTKLISSNAFGPLMKWTKSWTNTHISILEADWWKSRFALRQKSIGEKIIRSKVSSALLCEINWNLALPVRFFFLKTYVVTVWVQRLEADAEHGISDTTFWLEIGLWGFLLLASDTYVEK